MLREFRAPANLDGDGGQLLAVIATCEGYPNGVNFITDPANPQQVAVLKHPEGYTVPAHRHYGATRTVDCVQETLIVLKGRAKLDVYSYTREHLYAVEIGAGDIVLLMQGGHGLTVLEYCEIVEVRQGPYYGKIHDKVVY